MARYLILDDPKRATPRMPLGTVIDVRPTGAPLGRMEAAQFLVVDDDSTVEEAQAKWIASGETPDAMRKETVNLDALAVSAPDLVAARAHLATTLAEHRAFRAAQGAVRDQRKSALRASLGALEKVAVESGLTPDLASNPEILAHIHRAVVGLEDAHRGEFLASRATPVVAVTKAVLAAAVAAAVAAEAVEG